ncbi:aminoglycoside phosphotransferase family protein [Salinibacterium sp. NSLL150]|uniref:phosphotransferase family protein n=1 Tax=Salinibacterium sp. NK8237 TaxID=2792038 RepID=UPI0018CDB2C2|nr:aminoglycoside phosphotransferase family protein [Salinibacterium sp. NK8237]MBH0097969.1 aminoglycoside phosphotransferase family protein [Salinibacterium sp. NSLL35]MBH0100724.1 aminoglycoside phosphotransferase family protein [Salinibacterium sp. NSLL150]MBH0103483.1 aminoglycoside phosphotransferase family protein [Salinibacterium sp. NSLL16]MBH0106244.1 aminoglycoside phosphotransferase family protein [Salinibacterium sp. NSLL17]MBH0130255.1 aminoglycoside phosphotransferase family pro
MTVVEVDGVIAAVSEKLGRAITLVRPLAGGQHATTLVVADSTAEYVVRVFPTLDDAVVHEPPILDRVAALGERVPRLVATGQFGESPFIVTSVVPGGPPSPDVPLRRVAEQMAAVLAQIHELDSVGLRTLSWETPKGVSAIETRGRGAWQQLDRADRVLTHYDFWCGNALWEGDVLTGVVDWSGARSAPRGLDVSWCRLDLVLLGSIDAADHFLAEYERESGHSLPDIQAWDLVAAARSASRVETWAPNYLGVGYSDLTESALRARMDDWTARLCVS